MSSMFSVIGEVRNVFFQPGPVDQATGTSKPGSLKVQVLGEMPVQGGGSREDLITLTVPDGLDFNPLLKHTVRFPLGFFSPAKGSIIYFIPKGSEVEIIDSEGIVTLIKSSTPSMPTAVMSPL